MKNKVLKGIFFLIIALLIFAADQMVKCMIVSSANVGETIASMPLLDFTYVQNTGAAFSVFEGKLSFLTLVSIAFCIAEIVFWIKKKNIHTLLSVAMTLMFAGALGNAIDRIVRGFVVDFIRVTFINFPVFNIADIAIVTGATLLIVYEIFFDKSEKKS